MTYPCKWLVSFGSVKIISLASCSFRPQRPWSSCGTAEGKRNHKRSTTSDSEDSSPSKLIVTGKRVRKTVQREAWSDSGTDAEPDPYGSDDSEEWVPPSDATQTQDYSQEWD